MMHIPHPPCHCNVPIAVLARGPRSCAEAPANKGVCSFQIRPCNERNEYQCFYIAIIPITTGKAHCVHASLPDSKTPQSVKDHKSTFSMLAILKTPISVPACWFMTEVQNHILELAYPAYSLLLCMNPYRRQKGSCGLHVLSCFPWGWH